MTSVNSLTTGITGALSFTQVIVGVLSSSWTMANNFAETLVDRLKRTFTAIMIMFGRIRSSMKRLIGVFAIVVNMLTSLIATASSGINGPVGSTMRFFCYHPSSMIRLFNGQQIQISQVDMGDVLMGGHRVIGIMRSSPGYEMDFYHFDGAYVTAGHSVARVTSRRSIGNFTDADKWGLRPVMRGNSVLYNLITHTGIVESLNGSYVFLDQEED